MSTPNQRLIIAYMSYCGDRRGGCLWIEAWFDYGRTVPAISRVVDGNPPASKFQIDMAIEKA